MAKHEIPKTGFNWIAETKFAEDYGQKAANAFAQLMRQASRDNNLWFGSIDGVPSVLCGDRDYTDWKIKETFENLLYEYIKNAVYLKKPKHLTEILAVLQMASAKAEQALKKTSEKAERDLKKAGA